MVSSPQDLSEIRSIVTELDAHPSDIVLMPEGTQSGILRDRALWIAELCKAEGYRFSPRLHVDLWGDKRGV